MMGYKRDELLDILGNECVRCNITDPRLLTIDHVWGDGKDLPLTKKSVVDMYLENHFELKRSLQILCWNCHRLKSIENGDLGRKKNTPTALYVKVSEIPIPLLDNIDKYLD